MKLAIEDFVIDPDDEEEKQQQIFEVTTVVQIMTLPWAVLLLMLSDKQTTRELSPLKKAIPLSIHLILLRVWRLTQGSLVHTSSSEQGKFESVLEGVYVHLSKEIITQNDQIVPAMEKALGDRESVVDYC